MAMPLFVSLKQKALVFVSLCATTAFFMACQNEHMQFCTIATEKICERCADCGSDGLRQCGLLKAKTVRECQDTLLEVCISYDGVYNRELSRTCLDRIERTNCAQMRKEGKPDICNRLF